jgi:FkbM family methyltransferase
MPARDLVGPIYREFRSAARAVLHFGPYLGLRAYGIHSLATARESAISIPQVRGRIHLRRASTDWSVLEQIFMDVEYDVGVDGVNAALSDFYNRAVAAGRTPIIIDCGANIGLASIWFAERYPAAAIIAIEPEPGNFELLTRNIAAYPTIVPVQAAISDHQGRATLINAGSDAWGWETREASDGGVVTVTVPDLIATVPNGVPFIVKIDIEGGEVDLLRSNCDWIERTPLIVFEMHDWLFHGRGTGHAFFSRLATHRRDYIQRGENMFALSQSLLVLGASLLQ